MRRGTTPTITVSVDADITDMNIHLAFKCGSRLIVKQGDDLTVEAVEGGTEITTTLTQQDTLADYTAAANYPDPATYTYVED